MRIKAHFKTLFPLSSLLPLLNVFSSSRKEGVKVIMEYYIERNIFGKNLFFKMQWTVYFISTLLLFMSQGLYLGGRQEAGAGAGKS